jgi:hypothetical protein
MLMANRTGLGAPYLEGQLGRELLCPWLRSGVALTILRTADRAGVLGPITLSGLIFGWAHVDAQLGSPDPALGGLAGVMILGSLLGIAYGWLFWKLGIEWAVIAHFAYDAVVSAGLLKVYLLADGLLWAGFLSILILAAWMAWKAIRQNAHTVRSS